ncbi:hypothetical protein PJW08_00010 (plasmid) [Tenacibaculum finnmarkense]|nr:hypothetical protein PJW08_00010 [Tenacibaculum finnmarkense]
MNTKTFAQEARKILIQGVAKKLLYWGFNEKGETLEQPEKASEVILLEIKFLMILLCLTYGNRYKHP